LKSEDLTKDEDFDVTFTKKQQLGCPYIKTFINNKEYEMLLDSGAEICALSEEYYDQIIQDDSKIPVIPLTGLSIHNAIGNKPTKVTKQRLLSSRENYVKQNSTL